MTSSSSSYRGDSPSKKFARALYWSDVRKVLSKKRIHDGLHLVLSSKDAGDIACLLAMGARPSSIIAVDKDPEAALAVLEEYPGVKSINDDIFDVAKHYRGKLVSATFDFCNNVSLDIVDKISEVVRWLPDRGYWGAAFSYGREGDRAKSDLGHMRQTVLEWANAQQDRNVSVVAGDGSVMNMEEYKKALEVFNTLDLKSFEDRAYPIAMYVAWRVSTIDRPTLKMVGGGTCLYIQYKSTTEFSSGMPMFIIGNVTLKQQPAEKKISFAERCIAWTQIEPKTYIIPSDPWFYRVFIVEKYEYLRKAFGSHARVAQYFNIPIEQLNAWVGEQE